MGTYARCRWIGFERLMQIDGWVIFQKNVKFFRQMGSRAKIGKKWQMDGFERQMIDGFKSENCQIDGFERQILADRWVQERKLTKRLVDGWVWVEHFGRWIGGNSF